jgi:formamidopyrimidine-DNA glycosylase
MSHARGTIDHMPESPEVQALAEELRARLRSREVVSVDVLEFALVKTRARPPSRLVGARLEDAVRHGKYVDLVFDAAHLVVSLGRHGWARWASSQAEGAVGGDTPPALLSLGFDDGTVLEFTDAGEWVSLSAWVVDDPADVTGVASLGADPTDPDFVRADFDAVVRGRRKQVKAILQDQKSLAGIGNAYSDEILFAARTNPIARASDLGEGDLDRLYASTLEVVRSAMDARRGIPIAQLKAVKIGAMMVHGRAGQPCPQCAGTVRDFAFAGTTAQYCPACQTGGVIL